MSSLRTTLRACGLASVFLAAGALAQPTRAQAQGYVLEEVPNAYRDLLAAQHAQDLELPETDESGQGLEIGFSFPFFGQSYTTLGVASNGYLTFGTAINPLNEKIPSNFPPNGLIAPFWDDLAGQGARVLFERVEGEAGRRALIVQWDSFSAKGEVGSLLSFQVVLWESGEIQFHYGRMQNRDGTNGIGRASGSSATIGLEAPDGTYGVEVSFDRAGQVKTGGRGYAFVPGGPALPEGRLLGDVDGDGQITVLDQSRLVELGHPRYPPATALELVACDVAPLATDSVADVWGDRKIDVFDRDLVSDRILRRVSLPPYLGRVDPPVPAPGTTLTLIGSDYAALAADNNVVFSGVGGSQVVVPAASVNAGRTRVTVAVPAEARPGPVYLVREHQRSNARRIYVAGLPVVEVVNPNPVVAGEEITILGREFPELIGETAVQISGAAMSVVSVEQGVNGNPDTIVAVVSSALAAGVLPLRVSNPVRTSDPYDVGVGDLPFAKITFPTANLGVTNAIAVLGDASDPSDFARYELSIARLDVGEFSVIHSGTAAVNSGGQLGPFDPSTLVNGHYRMRLEVEDALGLTASDEVIFSVEGSLKLGHFTLAYTDLEVPVSGIALRVMREYDSREKASHDFGYGWRMRLVTLNVEEDDEHNVILQNPASWRIRFEFKPEQINVLDIRFWTAKFVNDEEQDHSELDFEVPTLQGVDPGNHTLLLDGVGNYFWFPSIVPFDPSVYRLTQLDGTVLRVHDKDGLLEVTKPDGNWIRVTPDGLLHSDGPGLTFTRDAANRIVRVEDPSSAALTYEYDSSGDLVKAIDADGVASSYDYYPDHYLRDWSEPGRSGSVRNEYDDAGRIIATVDPLGNRMELTHDVAGNREIVRDRLGRAMVTEYDSVGRVISATAYDGTTVQHEYDVRGNLVLLRDERGAEWRFEYDANNLQSAEVDPVGNRTTRSYDSRGNLLTITDPEGGTVTRTWSLDNRLLTETDPLGRTTERTYDAGGNLASIAYPDTTTVTYERDQENRLVRQIDRNGQEHLYSHDANGRILTKTRLVPRDGLPPTRAVSRYEYSPGGRITLEQRPDGSAVRTTYNEAGRELEEEVNGFLTTVFAYDPMGRRVQYLDPDGKAQVREYDPNGRLTSVTDEAGHRSAILDPKGRITTLTLPDQTQIFIGYDPAGNVTSRTDARGKVWGYVYDLAGRKIKDVLPTGGETVYTYNGRDQVLTIQDPDGDLTQFEYDLAGFQRAVILPTGKRLERTYDGFGRPLTTEDRHGRIVQLDYTPGGALNQPSRVRLALGEVRYEYNGRGKITSRIDGLGNETAFGYDADSGRRDNVRLPMGQEMRLDYDGLGHVSKTTDYNGEEVNHYYNEAGLLVQERYASGDGVRLVRDRLGRITKLDEARGETTLEYDAVGKLTEKIDPSGHRLAYDYDANGSVTTITTPAGFMRYEYDDDSRIVSVTDPWDRSATLTYTPGGRLASISRPNTVTTTITYATGGAVERLQHTDRQGTTLAGYTYTYVNGLRTRCDEDSGVRTDYEYDSLSRLTRVESTVASVSTTTIYGYDLAGNRTTQEFQRSDGTLLQTTYVHDANSRLIAESVTDTAPGAQAHVVGYTYDNNGSLLSRIAPLDSSSYTYDSKRRLIGVVRELNSVRTTVSYAYDHFGNRVETIRDGVRTIHLVDSNRPFARVIADMNDAGEVIRTYATAQLPLWARDPTTYEEEHWLQDGTLSTRLVTDENGAVTSTFDYSAFGELTQGTAREDQITYASDRMASDTGLVYLRARYLQVATGRFLTRDGFEGFQLEPISQNPYVYANQNPITNVDPPGTFSHSLAFTIGVTIPLALAAFDPVLMETKRLLVDGNRAMESAIRSHYQLPDALDQSVKVGFGLLLKLLQGTNILGAMFGPGILSRGPSDSEDGIANPSIVSAEVVFSGQAGPEHVLPSAIGLNGAVSTGAGVGLNPSERLAADTKNYGVGSSPPDLGAGSALIAEAVRWLKNRTQTYSDILITSKQRDAEGNQVGNNYVALQFTITATNTRWCVNVQGDGAVDTIGRLIANDPAVIACAFHESADATHFTEALARGCRPRYIEGQFHGAEGARIRRKEKLPYRSLITEPTQGHQIVGEGVVASSGEFVLSRTDLQVSGRGMGLRITRTYRSGVVFPHLYNFHMGYSWTLSCDERISGVTRTPDMFELDGQGRISGVHSYPSRLRGTVPTPPAGVFAHQVPDVVGYLIWPSMTRFAEGGYKRRTSTGTISTYNGRGWLVSRSDKNGNALQFIRDKEDLLRVIIDTQGREYRFSYEKKTAFRVEHDLLVRIEDVTGGRSVRYEYDSNLDLVAATSPGGRREEYVYSSDPDPALRHNMLRVIAPNQVADGDRTAVVTNIYSQSGLTKDRITGQLLGGRRTIELLNDDGEEEVSAGGTFSFRYTEASPPPPPPPPSSPASVPPTPPPPPLDPLNYGVLSTTVTDRRGNTLHYTFNVLGNPITYRDEEGYPTHYTYNADGLLRSTEFPNGQIEYFGYNTEAALPYNRGNLLFHLRLPSDGGAGVMTSYEYEPLYGQVTRTTSTEGFRAIFQPPEPGQSDADFVEDALGNADDTFSTLVIYDYQESTRPIREEDKIFGLSTRLIDELIDRGLGDVNGDGTTDSVAGQPVAFRKHLVSAPVPQEIWTYISYNEWGLPITVVDPEGSRQTFTYHDSGYVAENVKDPGNLSITTRATYNELGQLATATDARGTVTTYQYDLDGLLLEVHRAANRSVGFRVLYDYDANRNLLRTRLESKGDAQLPKGGFFETRQTYDILNQVFQKGNKLDDTFLVTRYFYDPGQVPTEVLLPEGNRVTYEHSPRKLLTARTRGEGSDAASTEQWGYDEARNVVVHIDGGDHRTERQYNGFSWPIRLLSPLQNQTVMEYDAVGNLSAVEAKTPAGVRVSRTEYVRDELYRVYEERRFISNTLHAVTKTRYDRVGLATSFTEPDLDTTTVVYDALGRPVSVTDPLGNVAVTTYDANSNVVRARSTESSGGASETYTTRMVYDALDRPIQTIDDLGRVSRVTYNSRSLPVATQDPRGPLGSDGRSAQDPAKFGGPINLAGLETRYEYDTVGRLLQTQADLREGAISSGNLETSPFNLDGRVTTKRTYDKNDNLIAATDDGGNVTSFEYDALDRMIRKRCADGQVFSTAFDRDDLVVHRVDANGTRLEFSYDDDDRLTSVLTGNPAPGVSPVSQRFTYDSLDRLLTAVEGVSPGTRSVIRTYDALSRVTSEQQGSRTVFYDYDIDSNLIGIHYPSGRDLTLSHDGLDRVTEIEEEFQSTTSLLAKYSYVGTSRLSKCELPNGTSTRIELGNGDLAYDQVKRPTGLVHQKDAGPNRFVQRSFDYDRANNRVSIARHDQAAVDQYTYDSLSRIAESRFDADFNGSAAPVASRNLSTRSYAMNGSHDWREVNTVDGSGGSNTTSYEANSVHEYTRVGPAVLRYDDNGSLISDGNVTGAGERTFTYDSFNRLHSVTQGSQTTTYQYDALGRRTKSSSSGAGTREIDFFHDGPRCIQERTNGGPRNGESREFVFGLGANDVILSQTVAGPSPDRRFHHAGIWDSTLALTNATGDVETRTLYDDYGRPFHSAGAPQGSYQNPVLFQGQRYDEESQLYYYRARHYDPILGRFLQRDPMGTWGDPGAHGNPYMGLRNNPINTVDPDGKLPILIPLAMIAAGAVNVAISYGVAKLMGKDYTWKDGAVDFVVGGLSVTAAGVLMRGAALASRGGKVMLAARTAFGEAAIATAGDSVRHYVLNKKGQFDPVATMGGHLAGNIAFGVGGAAGGAVFRGLAAGFRAGGRATGRGLGRLIGRVARNPCKVRGTAAGERFKGVLDWMHIKCFLAGTLVQTQSGRKPIEEIAVGDRVLSRDDSTGAQGYKRVVRLFRGETTRVVHLRIAKAASVQRGRSQRHRVGQGKGGSSSDGEEGSEPARSGGDDEQTLRCTTEHPFWVQGRGWVPAGKLRVGDELSGSQGERLVVSGHEVRQEQADHYNFEVEDWHTYFVSETEADPAVWNHNKCPPEVSGGSGLGANSHVDRIADEIAGAVAQADRVLRTGSAGGTRWGHIYQRLRGTGDWKEAMARGNALQQVADQLLRKNEYLRSAGVLFNKGSRLGLRGKKGLLRPDYQVPLANGRWAILDITTSGSARKIGKYADDLAPIRLNVLYR